MELSDQQLLRYSRHIMLPEVDVLGQERLSVARVLLLGAGGLGCAAAQYLVAAGIGALTLVDDDRVEWSNLQRQILFDTSQLNEFKVTAARDRLLQLNDAVQITAINRRLTGEALEAVIKEVDLVIDGTDNFASRFEHNRACVAQKCVLVSGAAIRLEGQLSVFALDREESPCYQCVFPNGMEVDQACATNGVLGPVVGTIGAMMASEAIKVLLGLQGALTSRLLLYDALHVQWREIKLKKDPQCSICRTDRN